MKLVSADVDRCCRVLNSGNVSFTVYFRADCSPGQSAAACVRLPLLSARCAFSCIAAEHHCDLADTKLTCLPKVATWEWHEWELNLQPVSCRPDAVIIVIMWIQCMCRMLIDAVGCCGLFRRFRLVLRKSSAVLARDFRVVTVDADNVEHVVDIKPAIYHGFLAGALQNIVEFNSIQLATGVPEWVDRK